MRSALDRQRDEALRSLEHRAHQVEARLRERLNEIAADAESERSVLEARLHDLQQRLDELTARA
jgi:polyhydroxyalkanoate synthesis regulator phasin